MGIYAVVESGAVTNVIEWDGVSYSAETPDGWTPPDGVQLVEIGDTPAGIGWTYDGATFSAPPAPPQPVLTPDQIRAANTAQQSSLNAIATNKIAIYTDATDPDIVDTVDPADTASLKAWKQYRVALNKVDLSQTSPAWPDVPA